MKGDGSNSSSRNESYTAGKGYSYLFACLFTFFLGLQSLNIGVEFNNKNPQIKISSREIPMHIFIPTVGIIASLLGVNTDGIATAFGKFLNQEK